MSSDQFKHNDLIMDQFSKQAVPFSQKVPAHSNEAAFKLIIETAQINSKDRVLDVACGPGMLTCAVAQKAEHVTGIDLVPAMIEQAKVLQKEKSLSNMDWKLGDVYKLPFKDGAFSVAMTRFSFHHFLKPQDVLMEMCRVVEHRGRVVVIDVFTTSAEHSKMHNLMEKLRDESHAHAFACQELEAMLVKAGLKNIRIAFYRLEIELEQQLSASFPLPGNDQKIRDLVKADAQGIVSMKKDGKTYLIYPIAILVGEKD